MLRRRTDSQLNPSRTRSSKARVQTRVADWAEIDGRSCELRHAFDLHPPSQLSEHYYHACIILVERLQCLRHWRVGSLAHRPIRHQGANPTSNPPSRRAASRPTPTSQHRRPRLLRPAEQPSSSGSPHPPHRPLLHPHQPNARQDALPPRISDQAHPPPSPPPLLHLRTDRAPSNARHPPSSPAQRQGGHAAAHHAACWMAAARLAAHLQTTTQTTCPHACTGNDFSNAVKQQ